MTRKGGMEEKITGREFWRERKGRGGILNERGREREGREKEMKGEGNEEGKGEWSSECGGEVTRPGTVLYIFYTYFFIEN